MDVFEETSDGLMDTISAGSVEILNVECDRVPISSTMTFDVIVCMASDSISICSVEDFAVVIGAV